MYIYINFLFKPKTCFQSKSGNEHKNAKRLSLMMILYSEIIVYLAMYFTFVLLFYMRKSLVFFFTYIYVYINVRIYVYLNECTCICFRACKRVYMCEYDENMSTYVSMFTSAGLEQL
uniref:Uncharacterized protein n=1 Tax=Glossina morsitans morsitans TaxID=37546 RepID=A0A1B0G1E9_GLOMM